MYMYTNPDKDKVEKSARYLTFEIANDSDYE